MIIHTTDFHSLYPTKNFLASDIKPIFKLLLPINFDFFPEILHDICNFNCSDSPPCFSCVQIIIYTIYERSMYVIFVAGVNRNKVGLLRITTQKLIQLGIIYSRNNAGYKIVERLLHRGKLTHFKIILGIFRENYIENRCMSVYVCVMVMHS